MSDEYLLVFGCAVSFIALAGFYLYLREAFSRGHAERESEQDAGVESGPRIEVRS